MPNWIEESKRRARKDFENSCLKIVSDNIVELKNFEKDLLIFHRNTRKSKQFIEKILIKAKKQGLVVEGPVEDYIYALYSYFSDSKIFLIWRDRIGDTDLYESINHPWGYVWTIKYIEEIQLLLTLNFSKKHVISPYIGITLYKNAGDGKEISRNNIESEIKEWLYRMSKREFKESFD